MLTRSGYRNSSLDLSDALLFKVFLIFHSFQPRSELDKPTDRNQRSWVFLSYRKNTLSLTEHPKKYFPKSKTRKNTLKNTIHLAKVKHYEIIMKNRDY